MNAARKEDKEREPVIKRFSHDGRTYEYNFGKLSFIQIQRGETVFRYREEQESNPPVSLSLLQTSAGGEYMIEAFRHLLIERTDDGLYVKYDKDSAGEKTRIWLEDVPAILNDGQNIWTELRECRLDFF